VEQKREFEEVEEVEEFMTIFPAAQPRRRR
jgi:hypothetical protein